MTLCNAEYRIDVPSQKGICDLLRKKADLHIDVNFTIFSILLPYCSRVELMRVYVRLVFSFIFNLKNPHPPKTLSIH